MRRAADLTSSSSRALLSIVSLLVLPVMCSQCLAQGDASPGWQQKLADTLPLYGHRNWICIVDSAYPAQARPAIETICTGADQLEVVSTVLKAVETSRHVRPVVYTDAELRFVPDELAPGISDYRTRLRAQLGPLAVNSVLHEDIIKMLDEAAQTFRVLILKTNMALPYTSVFIRLDCGYWPAASEQKLRQAMEAEK